MQPIHYATHGGHMHVIDELVEYGVNPNASVSYYAYIHAYIIMWLQCIFIMLHVHDL